MTSSGHIPGRILNPVPLILLACFLAVSCGQNEADAPPAQKEKAAKTTPSGGYTHYQLIQAELVLANAVKPYLVLDLAQGALKLKLKGVVMWDYPLAIDPEESDPLDRFARKFLADAGVPVRPVAEKYLFASQGRSPDTLLAIVSGALNVDPGLLQRDIPARFQIRWAKNLILDVSTDVVAKPRSRFKNTLVQVGQALQRPFGETRLTMKMHPEAALTFWRAVEVGVPTLILPPP
jgi:hypothetical protein